MAQVSSADEVELAGSRGTANFALKWARDARQQANLQVVEDIKGLPLRYTGEPASGTISSCIRHAVAPCPYVHLQVAKGSIKPASSSVLAKEGPGLSTYAW